MVEAVALRAAIRSDAERIAALHARSWRLAYRGAVSDAYLDFDIDDERRRLWTSRLDNPSPRQYAVVAERVGKLVGFACVFFDEHREWGSMLDNVHVDLEAQRSGVGTVLLREIARRCVERDRRGLFLWVLKHNAGAFAFYAAHGARKAGEDLWQAPDGSKVPRWRMAWRGRALPV